MNAMMSWRAREYGTDKGYDVVIQALDARSLAEVERIARDRGYDDIDAGPPGKSGGRGMELNIGVRWQKTFADRDNSDEELLALDEMGFQVDPDGPATQDALDRAKERRPS